MLLATGGDPGPVVFLTFVPPAETTILVRWIPAHVSAER